jgi:hypothetical protein
MPASVVESAGESCGLIHSLAARTIGDLPATSGAVLQSGDDFCSSALDTASAHDSDGNLVIGRQAFAPELLQPMLPIFPPTRYRNLKERRLKSLKLPSDDSSSPAKAIETPQVGQLGEHDFHAEFSGLDFQDVQEEFHNNAVKLGPRAEDMAPEPIDDVDVDYFESLAIGDVDVKRGREQAPTALRFRALPKFLKESRMRQALLLPSDTCSVPSDTPICPSNTRTTSMCVVRCDALDASAFPKKVCG